MHTRPDSHRPIDDEAPSVLEISYRILREAITSGTFRPGEHIRQERIASQLGISRGPAREALSRLAAEGFVRLRPRRGYVVESLNAEEVEDIFELRTILEERAGRLAARYRTAEDVAALQAVVDEMETLKTSSPDDIERFIGLNRAFHDRIYQCSGRKHLRRMLSTLRDSVEPYVRFSISNTNSPSGEHQRILDAVAARDEATSGRLLSEHCERVARTILVRLDS